MIPEIDRAITSFKKLHSKNIIITAVRNALENKKISNIDAAKILLEYCTDEVDDAILLKVEALIHKFDELSEKVAALDEQIQRTNQGGSTRKATPRNPQSNSLPPEPTDSTPTENDIGEEKERVVPEV